MSVKLNNAKKCGFGLMTCLIIVCIGFSMDVFAQNKKDDRTKQSSQSTIAELDERVKDLKAKTDNAIKRLTGALKGGDQDRRKELEDFLKTAKDALGAISEGGALYDKLDEAKKLTEEKQEKYDDRAKDPTISAKVREQYSNLARRFDKQIENFYEKRILLGKHRDEMMTMIKEMEDQKEFYADLVLANELQAANDALDLVLESAMKMNHSIGKFVNEMLEGREGLQR